MGTGVLVDFPDQNHGKHYKEKTFHSKEPRTFKKQTTTLICSSEHILFIEAGSGYSNPSLCVYKSSFQWKLAGGKKDTD